jgi:hypothetical protein
MAISMSRNDGPSGPIRAGLRQRHLFRIREAFRLSNRGSLDPSEPVVCFDEKPVSLHADVTPPRPMHVAGRVSPLSADLQAGAFESTLLDKHWKPKIIKAVQPSSFVAEAPPIRILDVIRYCGRALRLYHAQSGDRSISCRPSGLRMVNALSSSVPSEWSAIGNWEQRISGRQPWAALLAISWPFMDADIQPQPVCSFGS